jgi:hypothetical protein
MTIISPHTIEGSEDDQITHIHTHTYIYSKLTLDRVGKKGDGGVTETEDLEEEDFENITN